MNTDTEIKEQADSRSQRPSYMLLDGVNLHLAHPDTFAIPGSDDVMNMRPGDYVKLMFKSSTGVVERMWVRVTYNGGALSLWHGVRENQPTDAELPELGSEVCFGWRHVIDYMIPAPWGLSVLVSDD
jgi:hypothetical protein